MVLRETNQAILAVNEVFKGSHWLGNVILNFSSLTNEIYPSLSLIDQ